SRSSAPSRRFLSTAPPHEKSRSWKNSAVRWTLAGALVYYYNTSNVFAEEQSFVRHAPPETQIESETLPTLDAVTAKRHALQAQVKADAKKVAAAATDVVHTVREATTNAPVPEPEDGALAGSPQDLEEEASQQGAFNEETGEINWDCPCLGGMAYGPCGEQFREAFSCFVFSKEEPKGMDCIDKFKNMQNCFREHPDVYGAELEDDVEAEAREQDDAAAAAAGQSSQPTQPKANPDAEKVADKGADHPEAIQGKRERSNAATEQVKRDHDIMSESDSLVPKAAHDATGQESKGDK
ncbi:hypothetical protein KCU64_g9052, partial [Aureobasidium melanogenum]